MEEVSQEHCSSVQSGVQADQQELLEGLMRDMGLTLLRSFYVDHCSQAFGLALQVLPALHAAGTQLGV